ncbi:MAG: tetratricopeptide repeat protein [Alphaproteobacteria bacterium]|nr:tetratricopeptide repeat protein [Alphaproteobacteria bacterium]
MNFLQSLYLKHLQTINGVKLTRREVDIISFFVCGRSAKKFASFFNISPKTVESHTHNIMLKLGCNSRESIIDFIEKSDKFPNLRKYYTVILAQTVFDKYLKNISKLTQGEQLSLILTYCQKEDSQNFLISHIESSLKLSGIAVSIQPQNSLRSLQEIYEHNDVIYIGPSNWEYPYLEEKENPLSSQAKNCMLLFQPKREEPIVILEELDTVDFLDHGDPKNYYLPVFEILKQLLPNHNIEKIISDFQTECSIIEGNKNRDQHPNAEHNQVEKRMKLKNALVFTLRHKKWISIAILTTVIFSSLLALYEKKRERSFGLRQIVNQKQEKSLVRSELDVPIESVRLERPELIAKINARFKGWSGIQTVALVGIEGAGKTTLARQYASSQDLPHVWEINGESKETSNESFENLARVLSKTEEDQKILTGILKIRLSNEREEKIVQYVKERLKALSNWFLIYDNVEKFSDIQNYFPKDSDKWGQGRIILTTRDSNIENNTHVNNIIPIGELSADEKMNFFIKIMSNGGTRTFSAAQKEEIKKFLVAIPPFPLDISVAAYYLKATHIPYQSYLENAYKNNEDFSNIQKKILQEAGNYTKTRYGILTLTLRRLIEVNSDFKDLLFYISLLDYQSIPRDLLVKYKSDIVVDNFIYHLKLYSLIDYDTSESYDLISNFSIHKNIQNIMLTYLVKNLKSGQEKKLVQSIANVLENSMNDAIDNEDFTKMKILYRHADQFLSHSDLLNEDVKTNLSGELGCMCCYLCYYSKAKDMLESAISKSSKNYNKIAHFKVYLGNVYRRLGDYEKAKELFEQSLQTYKKCSEPNPGMARACGYLGIVYESLGNFEKAKALLEESLALHKKQKKNCIGLAWSLAHLASVYRNLGDYEKARELYEKSLKIYKTHSENYVGAAWVSGALGSVCTKLKDYEKAKNYLDESLKIYCNHFPENHIYVAYALIHLGVFYGETENFENAKSLIKKGLAAIEIAYGKDNVEVGAILNKLAIVYLLEGKLEIAEETIKRALNIFQKNKHHSKYECLEILAEVYEKKSKIKFSKGETQQADDLKEHASFHLFQALKITKPLFPKDSPHITRIESKIGKMKMEKF